MPKDQPREIDYSKVPVPHMVGAMRRYIDHGYQPGSFLSAVLCNDLMEAAKRADNDNAEALTKWVGFLYWEMPYPCFGSPERFHTWMSHNGLEGFEEYERQQREATTEEPNSN